MASADFNVRDFGAKGDGVADDTLAIQNAVTKACNEGQLLIFPQAEAGKYYKISNQIVIPWNTHDWAIRGAPHRARISASRQQFAVPALRFVQERHARTDERQLRCLEF